MQADAIGVTKSCQRCINKLKNKDLIGFRVGRLTVKELAYKNEKRKCLMWKCDCDCGQTTILPTNSLIGGCPTLSCGCLQKEASRKAGKDSAVKRAKNFSGNFIYNGCVREHTNYNSWFSMIQRCTNLSAKKFHLYGGRGIKVCERWSGELGFENFVNDMGERPSKNHSIDRIDVNGDYCPENCRWATRKEQENNKRNNNRVVLDGKPITVTQLCEMIAVNRNSIYQLLKRGVDINYILQVKLNSTKDEKRYTEHINFNRNIDNELINKFLIKIQQNKHI